MFRLFTDIKKRNGQRFPCSFQFLPTQELPHHSPSRRSSRNAFSRTEGSHHSFSGSTAININDSKPFNAYVRSSRQLLSPLADNVHRLLDITPKTNQHPRPSNWPSFSMRSPPDPSCRGPSISGPYDSHIIRFRLEIARPCAHEVPADIWHGFQPHPRATQGRGQTASRQARNKTQGTTVTVPTSSSLPPRSQRLAS